MQRTIRMIPPPRTSGYNPITINGRVYSSPSLATIDMIDFDADIAARNSWTPLGIVGTTSQRPVSTDTDMPAAGIRNGLRYIDTDLNVAVTYDAVNKTWRDPVTGAAA